MHKGDQNIKFFYASTQTRRRINHIDALLDKNGCMKGCENGLNEVMVDYFNDLFQASEIEWYEIIECIQPKVTSFQNMSLLAPVVESEVKKALFCMHPDKSPGPDGMSPDFYQKHWDMIREDMVKLVQQFFETSKFEHQVTDTNIVLIPKKSNSTRMLELRPISLYNVSYNIVSKVLANRLREVLDNIISPTQSAFVPGRLITNNIMISYEVMHYMKRKIKGKKSWMTLKLNMSKAYDKVE